MCHSLDVVGEVPLWPSLGKVPLCPLLKVDKLFFSLTLSLCLSLSYSVFFLTVSQAVSLSYHVCQPDILFL